MTTEHFAARWGRQLQYGMDPRDPGLPAIPSNPSASPTRGATIAALREWSPAIERVERHHDELRRVLLAQPSPPPDVSQVTESLIEPDPAMDACFVLLKSVAGALPR